MASPARSGTREEERRLSISTLVIASIASLTAAVVTSHFWLAGTPLAAAVTPVIVAIVSELLRKPTEVISQKLTTSDRTAVAPDRGSAVPQPPEPERRADAAAGAGRRRVPAQPSRPGRERLQEATSATVAKAGVPPAGGMHVYRPTRTRRRRIAVGVVAATAVLAFAIAAAVLTLPELIAGQSLTKSSRHTTLFGGSARRTSSTPTTPTPTAPTQSQPSTTPKGTTTNRTTTQPPSGGTNTQTQPKQSTQQQQQQPRQRSTTPSGGASGGGGSP